MSQKTIQCRLVASEDSRQFLWELMADNYTPFINELLEQVTKHSEFHHWRLQGSIPAKAVEDTYEDLRQSFMISPFFWMLVVADHQHRVNTIFSSLKIKPCFSVLPSRFQKSAITLVKRIYKSWFRLRSRLSWKLEGQSRWLEILQSDDEILEACQYDLATLQTKATEILTEIKNQASNSNPSSESDRQNTQKQSRQRKKKNKQNQTKPSSDPFQILMNFYKQEEDQQRRGTIAYLLKHDCCVPEKPEDPKKFAKRRRKAEIRLERTLRILERTRLPQGRNLSWQKWLEAVAKATEQVPSDEDEAANWQADILRGRHPLPFPVNYETNEDLIWSKNSEGRLCVTCSGFGRRSFEVYCDRRQLHWFERFLEDQHVKRASKDQHSASLFTLRSGRISWKEGTGGGKPWNANHLILFCTVETRIWSQEGTEEIRAEKASEIIKVIDRTKEKGNLTKSQEDFIKRKEKTLSLIENSFPRPSKPQYQGNPNILAGVSYGLGKPATLAIIDITTGKAIAYRSIKQLLEKNYRLLNRYRLRQQRNSHLRHNRQKKGAFNKIRESKRGEHLDRLIAHAIVVAAQEFRASSIVLPNLDNIREVTEAEIKARAEQKICGYQEGQRNYAKQYRANVHRWSYGRLTGNINSQAAQANIAVEQARQPFQGTPQEKARDLAITAYRNRNEARA